MLQRHVFPLLCAVAIAPIASCQMPRHAPPAAKIELPPDGVDLPMLAFKGLPVIEVKIDGKGPFPFILDTGANITVISEELQKELELAPPPGVKVNASGDSRVAAIVSILRLQFGAGLLMGAYAAVMPLTILGPHGPRGVLDASMFPGYLVAFNYPAKRVLIAKGELPPADSRTVFGYEDEEGIPSVPVRVDIQATRVHLDTGATRSLMLPNKYLSQLPLESEPREAAEKTRLVGREFPVVTARVKGSVAVGDFRLDIEEVGFSDARGGNRAPVGQLGSAALQLFVVTLDAKNRRIRLERKTSPSPIPGK